MPERARLRWFAVRFIVWFLILSHPWPGIPMAVHHTLRLECRLLLGLLLPHAQGTVAYHVDPAHPGLDTRVTLVDRRSGTGVFVEQVVITLDSRSLAWIPNAMLIALVAATPWKMRYRLSALGLGLAPLNAFIGLTALASILSGWCSRGDGGWMEQLVQGAHRLLAVNLWASFIVPAVIWAASLQRASGSALPWLPTNPATRRQPSERV